MAPFASTAPGREPLDGERGRPHGRALRHRARRRGVDGSVAAWDAATFEVRWRGNVGASVQAIALASGRVVIVPIGVGAAAAPVYLPSGAFADRVALAPPARKPIGGENCDGCGTPALVWDGSVQQGCPVCSAGTVVNACALARDEAAPRGRLRPSLHACTPMPATTTYTQHSRHRRRDGVSPPRRHSRKHGHQPAAGPSRSRRR